MSAGCATTDVACQCNSIAEYRIEDSLDQCAIIECSDSVVGVGVLGIFLTQCLNYYSSTVANFASTAEVATTHFSSAGAATTTPDTSTTSESQAQETSTSSAVVKTDVLPSTTAQSTSERGSNAAATVTTASEVESTGEITGESAASSSTSSSLISEQTGGADSSITSGSSSSSSSGLSSGAKAGIGIGVTLGVLAILGLIWLAFWYGRKSSADKKKDEASTLPASIPKPDEPKIVVEPKPIVSPVVSPIPEMESPLNSEEKAELEGRRRAAELQGQLVVPGLEFGGGERYELEARRRIAKQVYELH